MMKMYLFSLKWCGLKPNIALMLLMAVVVIGLSQGLSRAKDSDDQNQIILLNDSASALSDSNPGLSRTLAKFAEDKEKEWEDKNAGNIGSQTTGNKNNIGQLQYRIKLYKQAALALQPDYPLIAKGLNKMANDINKSMEIERING
jgi:hypothetical protein